MLRSTAIAAGLVFACSALAQSASETRYAVLIMEKPAGTQTTAVTADGTRTMSYEYNDRGRGPKLTARVQLDADQVPVSLEMEGVDYLKAPVAEKFTFANGVARWKNSAEAGEQKLAGHAFYLTTQGLPEELGWLAHALLKAPGQRMALLPAGEASIKRADELSVGDGANKRHVTAYLIEGLGFSPSTVWLDDEQGFFASVDRFYSVVRAGWESSVPKLLEKQEARASTRTLELARTLIRRPKQPVAITNANVFDSATGQSAPGSTVLIDGNRIRTVGKDGAVTIPSQAERIDAGGKTLLPGLWDMHVHMGPTDGMLHMAAGVTSVRDLANDNDALLQMKREIDSGTAIGPRITMRGFMDGRGPYTGPTKVFVDTEAEARSAIDNYAKLGYEGIKVYSSIKPELVPTIIKLAHEKGLRVSGHVPAFMTARQFVEAGADEIQHINMLFLNFFFDEVKDTRTPARFIAVAERGATLDLNSLPVQAFLRLLKDHNTVIDPTLTAFEGMFVDRPGKMSVSYAAIADRLPPQVRREFLAGGLPVPEGKDARYHESQLATLRMTKLLYDSGIPIVAGTDGLPGFTLHRELELYAQAGISPPEVLRIATLGAARVAHKDKELGSITPGKLADLVLIDGDPAKRISDVRRTALVMKDGALYEPAALYKALGVKP
ncbi:MAG TPA: amidohydrolase family protein [Steroidobacteraceae bacterium]|jgi:imidazolonepropionase-like amidohydrolase|nr:amidohydrolase family protein [Steroidobacteraceae bacterium]